MSSLNKVLVIGRLTDDPEFKQVGDLDICDFSIAVNEKFKDKEEVSFFNVTFFGKKAVIIPDYFSRGQEILVEGKLKQERWESEQGDSRSKVKIVGFNFSFVGSKADNEAHTDQSNDSVKPSAVPF